MQSIYANCNFEVTLEERIATFHILNGEVKENGILGERESASVYFVEISQPTVVNNQDFLKTE